MRSGGCLRATAALGLTAAALFGAAGVAGAQPDPTPPAPSLIDQLITSTQAFWAGPQNNGARADDSDQVGMYCQNLSVKCR